MLRIAGLSLALAASSAGACGLKDLAWMAGTWRTESDGRLTEERWIGGPDDILIGSSWTMKPGGEPFIEAMTISDDQAGLALKLRHFSRNLAHAMEDADAPMLFTLASCGPDSAIFDGQGAKAGEHITYRRQDKQLQFVGDFIHGGRPVRVEVTFAKAAD
jgi:hypothetical protein